MEKMTAFENWEQVKKQMQTKYPDLTNEDLAYEIGKEGELLTRLQQKLGKNAEEIKSWLSLMG